jgi:two-component sensor histidine kinase
MFIDLQNRIRAMALIHEKLYQTGEWAKIDFAGYVRDLSAYLFQSYQVNPAAVTLEVSFENVFLPANTAIPCGLIITELISNSLKHAFPAGLGRTGQIRIDFEMMADDRFVLVVSDNGVGLPEAIELQRTETLGLQLVRMLTRQLGGVIGIERNLGTTFKITFRA